MGTRQLSSHEWPERGETDRKGHIIFLRGARPLASLMGDLWHSANQFDDN